MATLQEVKQAIADEKAQVLEGITALNAKIQELQDQINQGTNVTAQDLEDIKNDVNNIFTP